MDLTSYVMGKKAGGGSPTPISLQDKEVTITQNGETEVTADSGYDGLNRVDITTNVPQPSGKITITENGTDINVSSYATADVSVAGQKYAPRIPRNGGFNFNAYYGNDLTYEITQIDTSNIVTFQNTFRMCKNLTYNDAFWGYLAQWNTQNVETAYGMFDMISTSSEPNNTFKKVNLSSWTFPKLTSMGTMFQYNATLEEVDLSSANPAELTIFNKVFLGCTNLKKLDIRSMDLTSITNSTDAFGNNQYGYVPTNCEIIVKDATQKQWMNTNFSRMTNVKTVAEL